jgi:glycerate kinase
LKPSKIIIAPDSFKGALSSRQAADIIAAEINAVFPECQIVKMPIADGGEGYGTP